MGTAQYRRKKRNKGDHPIKEKYRTKRKTKDLDEIQDDLRPGKVRALSTLIRSRLCCCERCRIVYWTLLSGSEADEARCR